MAERELDGMDPGLREAPGRAQISEDRERTETFPLDPVRLDAREGVGR